MAYTVRGTAAQIRWGYQTAAVLGSWTLEGRSLIATIAQVDTFRASQSPLTFVVGPLVRSVEGLQIAGASLTATLGLPKDAP